MALTVEVGTFAWPNTTAAQTISLADSGLTPKAVIMWTTGPGATSDSFSAGSIFSLGFGTRRSGATQSGCMGQINIDNVATSDSARVRNTTLLHVLSSTSATDYTITLDSFGAGTIGVTASSGTNANGDRLHYLAIGGSDLTDAIVLNWTMDAVAGAEVVTGAGFQPDALFCMDSDQAAANTITAGMAYTIGCASSATKFSYIFGGADDADTMTSGMNWNVTQGVTACLTRPTNTIGIDAQWDLDSFDSDGASLGVVDAPTNTDRVATLLFLKGGTWEAGQLAKDIDTGTDDFALANGSLTPRGIFTLGIKSATANDSTLLINQSGIMVGACDATPHEASAGICGQEAINTATDRYWSNTKAMIEIVGNTPTLGSAADFSAFSAGAFQLNWSSNDGVANKIGYMAFGDNAGAGFDPATVIPSIDQMKNSGFVGRVYV